jgi:tRNA-2-methylthio-N6-dimethylallyladenosine synthase
MPGQVPESVREARHERLLRLVNEVAAKRYEALVGRTVEILVEGPSKRNPERLTGRTRCNKIVVFEGSERHRSQVMSVRVVRTGSFTLYGDPAVINLDK